MMDNPWGMIAAMLYGADHNRKRRERFELMQVEEALKRCGFSYSQDCMRNVIISNAAGEEVTKEEQRTLAEELLKVRAEWAQRAAEAKRIREEQDAADAARRRFDYEKAAAPYREQRRLRNLLKIQQQNQRKP